MAVVLSTLIVCESGKRVSALLRLPATPVVRRADVMLVGRSEKIPVERRRIGIIGEIEARDRIDIRASLNELGNFVFRRVVTALSGACRVVGPGRQIMYEFL